MDTHRDINAVDEDELLSDKSVTPSTRHIAFKLPAKSHLLDAIAGQDSLIIWMERQALDVVYSMCKLEIVRRVRYLHLMKTLWANKYHKVVSLFPPKFNYYWINLDAGGVIEKSNLLRGATRLEINTEALENVHRELIMRRKCLNELEGLYIYYLKMLYYRQYVAIGLNVHKVIYEDLIRDVATTMGSIFELLKVEYDPRVEQHHLYAKGVSIGNTINDQPIMKNNRSKYQREWSQEKVAYLEAANEQYRKVVNEVF